MAKRTKKQEKLAEVWKLLVEASAYLSKKHYRKAHACVDKAWQTIDGAIDLKD